MSQNLPPGLPPTVPEGTPQKAVTAPPPGGLTRTRRRWRVPVIGLILWAAAGALTIAPFQALGASSDPLTLAVGAIADNNSVTPPHVLTAINDMLYSTLGETKKFTLVERSRTAEMVEENRALDKDKGDASRKPVAEQANVTVAGGDMDTLARNLIKSMQAAGTALKEGERARMDGTDLAKVRKLTRAEYFLVGIVTDFYSEQTVREPDSMGRQSRRSALSITVDSRLVNTRTGEILPVPTIHLEEPRVAPTPGNALADRLRKLELDMARTAGRKIAYGIVNELFPISIASVADGKAYLNRGSALGVAQGDTFTVVSLGAPIIDPDTKKEIGRVEKAVADLVVTEAREKLAIASIVADDPKAVREGMICRPSGKTADSKKEIASADPKGAAVPDVPRADSGRMRIAIMPLINSAKADPKMVSDAQSFFYTEMGKYPNVQLIERQQLDKIGSELTLTEEGYASPATAIRIGQLTGAQYMLVGSLVRATEKATDSALRPDLRKTVTNVSVEMDCRIVDTGKGEIWKTASAQKESSGESAASERATSLRAAAADACRQLLGAQPAAMAEAGAPAATATPAPAAAGAAAPIPAAGAIPEKNPEQKVPGEYLAMSRFANSPGGNVPETMLKYLDTKLETALVRTKRIPMVERADDRFVDELVFAQKTGFVDPKTIPQTGKLAGAKYYLATQVIRYQADAWGGRGALPNVYENGWEVTIEIGAKLLEVETGRILDSHPITKLRQGSSEDASALKEVPNLGQVTSDLASDVADGLTREVIGTLFPVVIADVTESKIYLDQGASTGVQAGDRFEVFALGREITQPTTGRVIGRDKTRVGVVEVASVEREMAIAAPMGETPIEKFARGMECHVEQALPPASKRPRQPAAGQAAKADPPPAPPAEAAAPQMKEKVFSLAPMNNSASAPRRVEVAIQKSLSGQIRKTGNEVVTRDEDELAEIGKEFLRGKSRMMDDATRLKAVKLTGARYIVFLEITDWLSQIRTDKIPMTTQTVDIQVVNIALGGSVVDLKTGKVLSSAHATASSPRSELVVNGQGDLNMDVKVAGEATDKIFSQMKDDKAFGK